MKQVTLRPLWIIGAALTAWHFPATAQIGQLEWQFATNSPIWGNVEISDDLAFIANDAGQIFAIDLINKKQQWQFTTQGKVRSSAGIYKDLVLFSSDDGLLYALDKHSGKLIWQRDLGDKEYQRILPANHAPWVFDYNKSSPVISGDIVYVGSATGELFAFNATNGKKVWSYKAKDAIRSTPTVVDNTVYVSAKDGMTYALDKTNGDVRWQHKSNAAIISDPLFIDDKIIIGSRDTNIYALNAHTGKEEWRYTFPDQSWVESTASSSSDGKAFYIGSSDSQTLHKFDVKTGEVLWRYNTKGWTWGAPFEHNDVVYVGSMSTDQYWRIPYRAFHAVDVQSGELEWQYQPARSDTFVTGGVHGQAAVYQDQLLVPDLDGSMKVFSLH